MYYVEALTQKRQSEWDRIFGMTVLPVHGPEPVMTPGQKMAYKLNAAALTPNHVTRLIGWLIMHRGFSDDVARKEVYAGFPITADETVRLVIKSNDEQGGSRYPSARFHFPFPFANPEFIRSLF